TCEKCGYSYNDDYAGPVHTPGEWVTAIEPTYMENGMSRLYCSVCKQLLEEKEIPKLVYVSFCRLDHTELDLSYRSSEVLNVEILPSDATDTGYVWSTSDDRVATVSKYGDIYATGPGTAVITCASEDGYSSDTCTVTVTYAWWQWMIVILLFGWIWY
ncbi:MAG: Ig-like domain-containing protein, partial [Clostridia bacterium]